MGPAMEQEESERARERKRVTRPDKSRKPCRIAPSAYIRKIFLRLCSTSARPTTHNEAINTRKVFKVGSSIANFN